MLSEGGGASASVGSFGSEEQSALSQTGTERGWVRLVRRLVGCGSSGGRLTQRRGARRGRGPASDFGSMGSFRTDGGLPNCPAGLVPPVASFGAGAEWARGAGSRLAGVKTGFRVVVGQVGRARWVRSVASGQPDGDGTRWVRLGECGRRSPIPGERLTQRRRAVRLVRSIQRSAISQTGTGPVGSFGAGYERVKERRRIAVAGDEAGWDAIPPIETTGRAFRYRGTERATGGRSFWFSVGGGGEKAQTRLDWANVERVILADLAARRVTQSRIISSIEAKMPQERAYAREIGIGGADGLCEVGSKWRSAVSRNLSASKLNCGAWPPSPGERNTVWVGSIASASGLLVRRTTNL